MNPEERLDRLEALAGLLVAGEQRRRKNLQEQDEKINILIKMQIESESRFNERFAKNEERFERTQQAIDRLVAAQARTDEKLQVLIDTLRRTNLGGLFA